MSTGLVVDFARQHLAGSLRAFCDGPLRGNFSQPWTREQLLLSLQLEACVLRGACLDRDVDRGTGATTLLHAAACWAIAAGHKQYVLLLGPMAAAADWMWGYAAAEFGCNELLSGMFPEVNWRGCDQSHSRRVFRFSAHQRTAVIQMASLGASLRGMRQMADGEVLRPDLILVDNSHCHRTERSPAARMQREKELRHVKVWAPHLVVRSIDR